MKLIIKDTLGNPIKLQDWVKVTGEHYRSSPESFAFYVQVQLRDGKLIPFQNFAYDQIEKVDGPPLGIESNKDGVYFHRNPQVSLDETIRKEYMMNKTIFDTLTDKFFTITE